MLPLDTARLLKKHESNVDYRIAQEWRQNIIPPMLNICSQVLLARVIIILALGENKREEEAVINNSVFSQVTVVINGCSKNKDTQTFSFGGPKLTPNGGPEYLIFKKMKEKCHSGCHAQIIKKKNIRDSTYLNLTKLEQ